MIVRECKKQDIPQVIRLSQQLAAHVEDPDPKLSADTLSELAFGNDRWFEALVAEEAGSLVGLIAYTQRFELHTNSRNLFVSDLIVSDTHRGQGIGEKLLDTLRAVAVERNCNAINLELWIENKSASNFYTDFGAKSVADVKLLRLALKQ